MGSLNAFINNWKRGETVTLNLRLSKRLILGDHENEGRAAIQVGPLVLALDTSLNPGLTNVNRAELSPDALQNLSLAPGDQRSETPRFSLPGKINGESKTLMLTPFACAGQDHKSHFTVWIFQPGRALSSDSLSSLFGDAKPSYSRQGNLEGDITDGDFDTLRVTYDATYAQEDWYSLNRPTPILISRILFAHGKTFHDGGWFDASAGKPRIQVQTEINGPWQTVATLDNYPAATATDSKSLQPGQKFEVKFSPVKAFAIRIIGKPATGDSPTQSFSSCSELQAFAR